MTLFWYTLTVAVLAAAIGAGAHWLIVRPELKALRTQNEQFRTSVTQLRDRIRELATALADAQPPF